MGKSRIKNQIDDDDILKTKEYAEAIDKLNGSLTSVNSALPKFADGLDTGLKAIAEKLPDVVASMTKLNVQNKELAESGQKPISVLAQLSTSLFSWNNLVTIGITMITTYGGAIIKWAADMIKGETSLNALTKAFKDNKIVLDALMKVRQQGTQNAQQELYHLSLLYKASQDQKVSLEDRKKIINELQSIYPAYFGTLTTQQILNGQAEESYKKLTKAVEAHSRAKVAEDAVTQNKQRQLGNATQLKQLEDELKKYTDLLKEAKKDYNEIINAPKVIGNGTIPITGDSRESNAHKKIDELQSKIDKVKKSISDINEDSKLLGRQNTVIMQSALTDAEQFGATVLGVNSILDKTIKKKNISKSVKPAAATHIEALSIDFSKSVEITNQNYESELAALKIQLDKKLITQQQYQEQSKALQEKFHQNLGQNIEKFLGTDFENAQKHLKDLGTQARLKELINYDERKVKKAILPGDKLATDKQLITDKYDLEISLANGNADKIKQLEQNKQQKITELNKRYAQERKDFELQTTQEVSNAAFSILQNSIKSQSGAKIKQLETQKASELNNSSLTATQKKVIEDKYSKKEAEEKTKAFKAEQRASLLQAVINGALAITKVTSQSGILAPFVIPGIIAETAIQVATIAAQKAPQYAKGGVHYQSDGRGALLPGYSRTDNMNAYLRSGEAVVVSEAMRDPWARNLVSAINVAYGGRDFSMANPQRGYAIGGIFTDGGNSNRYYNAPMNDQKDLANTIAYQMINNFPPVYVDVKNINTQQSILAQTINRVNL